MTQRLSARQRHYLALLGIDHFVRREPAPVVATPMEPEAEPLRSELQPPRADAQPPEDLAHEDPAARLDDVRAAVSVPEREPESMPEAEEKQVAPPPKPRPSEVPAFRLLLLEAGGGLLLANRDVLEQAHDAGHQTQRLGDVLRAAVLLRQGTVPEALKRSEFFWPQVDDPGLDQSLPRAQQALHYYLTRRPEAEPPLFVLRVHAEPGETDADRMLQGLMLDDLPVLDVPPAALTDGRSLQPLWDRLQRLWRPD